MGRQPLSPPACAEEVVSGQVTLSRRCLLGAAGLFVLGPRALAGEAPRGLIRFAVFRNGHRIGRHEVAVSGDASERQIAISAEMAVSLGPIRLFSYSHRSTEVWKGDQFLRLQSRSLTNGKLEEVTAERGARGVAIQPAKGPALIASADARPLSHWNRAALDGPLFNPQTGKLMQVRAEHPGPGMVALRGEVEITDWYDAQGGWSGLKARATDGSTIDYRLTSA